MLGCQIYLAALRTSILSQRRPLKSLLQARMGVQGIKIFGTLAFDMRGYDLWLHTRAKLPFKMEVFFRPHSMSIDNRFEVGLRLMDRKIIAVRRRS